MPSSKELGSAPSASNSSTRVPPTETTVALPVNNVTLLEYLPEAVIPLLSPANPPQTRPITQNRPNETPTRSLPNQASNRPNPDEEELLSTNTDADPSTDPGTSAGTRRVKKSSKQEKRSGRRESDSSDSETNLRRSEVLEAVQTGVREGLRQRPITNEPIVVAMVTLAILVALHRIGSRIPGGRRAVHWVFPTPPGLTRRNGSDGSNTVQGSGSIHASTTNITPSPPLVIPPFPVPVPPAAVPPAAVQPTVVPVPFPLPYPVPGPTVFVPIPVYMPTPPRDDDGAGAAQDRQG